MQVRFGTGPWLLSIRQLDLLVEQSLQVLARSAFRIQGTDDFFDLVRAFGCGIDGEKVTFPPSVVDEVLEHIRVQKAAVMANEQSRPASGEQTGLARTTHGQAIHICDTRSSRLRPATVSDLASWSRVVDSFGDVDRQHPTFVPTDVPQGAADLHAFTTIILNSRSPHRVSVYSARMLPFFIRAQAVVQGSEEKVRERPLFATKCWVSSPFMITRENIEIAMEARRLLGAPVVFDAMPVCGASAPVTVAGSLVQNTAECLAVCALSLALGGELVHCGPPGAVLDFRAMSHRQSGPDYLLHSVAGADMEEYLFGRRPAFESWGVGAQTVSAQSLYEKARSATTCVLLGGRRLGIGCLAYSDVGSPVQLVLDYEMGRELRHLLRDVSFDDDHIGMRSILDTIPRGGAFMETEHTAQHFREETWMSRLVDTRPPLAWEKDPVDMIEAARNQAIEIEEQAENQCPLAEHQRKAIRGIEREADRAARDRRVLPPNR